jgi:hypothetical protein
MNSIFIPKANLGIALEAAIKAVFVEPSKRKRQVRFKRVVEVLKTLSLLDEKAEPIGLAEGVNYLGEQGFWIVQEAVREVVEGPRCEFQPGDGPRCVLLQGHDGGHLAQTVNGKQCTCRGATYDASRGLHLDEECPLFDGMALTEAQARIDWPHTFWPYTPDGDYCRLCSLSRVGGMHNV